jgi:uncharacterized protein (TIGR02118 family)
MIKLVFCLRRLPHLSRDEFQRRWRGEHGPLVQKHASTLKLRRYVQCHTLSDPRVAAVAQVRGSDGREFDGVAELWWDGVESILEVLSTGAGQAAAAALLQDEARFIDLPNSPIFFSEEVVLVG